MRACALILAAVYFPGAAADLLVAENSLKPWPSGHGEKPPPLGSLVRLNARGERTVVATGLVDPVWVVGSSDGAEAYVGLFHAGEIVRISLTNGSVATVAKGLSCPEGVALDDHGFLYVVENPVGDECQATFPIKKAAQLTRIDLQSGAQTMVASLRSSTGSDEGGPHGLAIEGGSAFVCDCPADAAALVQVELSSGTKSIVSNLTSPSGCAVGGRFAYVVEQGSIDGQLVRVSLKDGTKTILLKRLAGPMGVAVDDFAGYVYVEERHKNSVRRVSLSNGKDEVFATGLKSPIGLAVPGRGSR